jgi:hypothetical protein
MILQRHTGSHSAVPLLQPVTDAPLAPDAGKKKSEQTQDLQPGTPCQADSKTQD